MPNHVFNFMHIESASKAELDAFVEKARTPYTYVVDGYDIEARQRTGLKEVTRQGEFNYGAFVPVPENGEGYSEWYDSDGKLQQPWYHWNINNWGSKWDAYDLDMERQSDTALAIRWCSAWSPVEEVIRAICEQFPNLAIDYEYEEEQGWGAELTSPAGDPMLHTLKEWDIPDSHADYKALGKEDSCYCAELDQEEWFDDCPRDEEEDN